MTTGVCPQGFASGTRGPSRREGEEEPRAEPQATESLCGMCKQHAPMDTSMESLPSSSFRQRPEYREGPKVAVSAGEQSHVSPARGTSPHGISPGRAQLATRGRGTEQTSGLGSQREAGTGRLD